MRAAASELIGLLGTDEQYVFENRPIRREQPCYFSQYAIDKYRAPDAGPIAAQY